MAIDRNLNEVTQWRLGQRGLERGFTLIELVMVLVILGVLAVFAVPRMFNKSDFDARGFHDETLALLRYAQKAATAQRRTVCVTFTDTSASLAIATTASTFNCTAAATLTGPNGAATINAHSGVAYSTLPTNFNFDAWGQPITSSGTAMATQNIHVSNASDVIVETVTGSVHD